MRIAHYSMDAKWCVETINKQKGDIFQRISISIDVWLDKSLPDTSAPQSVQDFFFYAFAYSLDGFIERVGLPKVRDKLA